MLLILFVLAFYVFYFFNHRSNTEGFTVSVDFNCILVYIREKSTLQQQEARQAFSFLFGLFIFYVFFFLH